MKNMKNVLLKGIRCCCNACTCAIAIGNLPQALRYRKMQYMFLEREIMPNGRHYGRDCFDEIAI